MQLDMFSSQEEKNHTSVAEIDVDKSIPLDSPLTVVSLFSGCGGMDLGFRGDFTIWGKYYGKNPFDIIYASDIEKKATETYTYNFKHQAECIDIREKDKNLLPKADIVIGGFPCQDFSLAGKRKGLSSERGQLYLEMKEAIEAIKPKAFVAENVDGIRVAQKGNDTSALDHILQEFEEIGYDVVYKVLNAKHFGVPQNRVRVIIVGIRNDLKKMMYYPIPKYSEKKNNIMTSKQAIDDLWDKLDTDCVPNHTSRDYSKAKFYLGKTMQGNNQISADKPAPTIRAEHHGNIEGHYRSYNENNPEDITAWRRLSVRECARLQSFPDDFIFPIASTYAYKQIGNAVPPIMAWNIARALYLSLTK